MPKQSPCADLLCRAIVCEGIIVRRGGGAQTRKLLTNQGFDFFVLFRLSWISFDVLVEESVCASFVVEACALASSVACCTRAAKRRGHKMCEENSA